MKSNVKLIYIPFIILLEVLVSLTAVLYAVVTPFRAITLYLEGHLSLHSVVMSAALMAICVRYLLSFHSLRRDYIRVGALAVDTDDFGEVVEDASTPFGPCVCTRCHHQLESITTNSEVV